MTYSLGITGARSDQVNQAELVTIADQAVAGGQTLTIPTPGGMAYAMSLGLPFRGRDVAGVERWYTFDAERSTPTVPILKPVG